ncbi:hypothetical protein [Mesorhizobium australicum]
MGDIGGPAACIEQACAEEADIERHRMAQRVAEGRERVEGAVGK